MNSFLSPLHSWTLLDSWIVVIGALSAMACALPGCFLLLRKQSLMGDAISHTSLLGVVAAFFVSHWLVEAKVISPATELSVRHVTMCVGAIVVGVMSAWLTESLQKLGNVESSAALGVVFTSLFALGLLLIRAFADNVHIDLDCVLYGEIVTAPLETVGNSGVPRAVIVNGVVLAINLLLTVLLFKELRLSAFDPALATTLGIPAQVMHYGLMGLTAMTLVAAFESVGSILVIAMLIIPPATAYLLTDRLPRMIVLSLLIAVLSAALGHVSALTLPLLISRSIGIADVRDASSAGMMAAAAGFLFVMAMLLGPKYGLVVRVWHRLLLKLRIAGEDVLGRLYRFEESAPADLSATSERVALLRKITSQSRVSRLATWMLIRRGWLIGSGSGVHLTDIGREAARTLVRSHRLWESFLAKHFVLGEGRFHESAEQVEHFLDPELLAELDHDLDRPGVDPHGRAIPN
ncbi:manganese ABC transporter permease [Planctomycetia bacterium]|nr:manganese ABC transporter permease [Planctomycetia bacterium]